MCSGLADTSGLNQRHYYTEPVKDNEPEDDGHYTSSIRDPQIIKTNDLAGRAMTGKPSRQVAPPSEFLRTRSNW
jgi:hypothetical protein